MAKYIDAEKLITEIERLQHLNECYKRNWQWKFKWFSRTVIGRMEVLEGIKNFINSLQQEQPSENLEEAADKYAGDSTGFIDMTAYNAFKAGAEWQRHKEESK